MSLHHTLICAFIYTSKDEVAFLKGAYSRNVFSVNVVVKSVPLCGRVYVDAILTFIFPTLPCM